MKLQFSPLFLVKHHLQSIPLMPNTHIKIMKNCTGYFLSEKPFQNNPSSCPLSGKHRKYFSKEHLCCKQSASFSSLIILRSLSPGEQCKFSWKCWCWHRAKFLMSLDKLYSVTNFIRAFKFDVCGNALKLKSKQPNRANKQKLEK